MTDFKDDKITPRPSRLSPQDEHFDFDLADMRVLPDQDIQPSPLEHLSDGVLGDAKPAEQHKPASHFAHADDETLLPPTPEIKTSFYVDYFDKRKKTKNKNKTVQVNTDTISTAAIIEPQLAPAQETPAQENIRPEPQIQHTAELEPVPEEHNTYTPSNAEPENTTEPSFINGSGMAVAVLSQFKSKQESINKQQEKLIQEFSKKIKSATRITYLSMLFGIAALAIALKLGVSLFQTENKLTELEKTNASLKDDLRNIKSLPMGDEGTDPSLDQITQKIDSVEEQLSDMAELQNKVALLEKNTLALVKQSTALPPAKTETQTPTATTPANVTAELEPIAKKPNNVVAEKAANKTVAPVKPSHDEPKPQAQTPAKLAATKPNTTTNKKDDLMEKAIAVPANDINKVTAETARLQNNKSNTTAKSNSQSAGSWTVNLASSNRLEEAKKTAASFQQKGIPVTLSPVTVKNETRYRLQVKGFKNKEEATAYANKAKATLHLNSVWVNP